MSGEAIDGFIVCVDELGRVVGRGRKGLDDGKIPVVVGEEERWLMGL